MSWMLIYRTYSTFLNSHCWLALIFELPLPGNGRRRRVLRRPSPPRRASSLLRVDVVRKSSKRKKIRLLTSSNFYAVDAGTKATYRSVIVVRGKAVK